VSTLQFRGCGIEAEPSSSHIAQLFDTSKSLAEAVGAFLLDGWERNQQLLAVATPAHWRLIADRLERRGCDVEEAIQRGRLVVLDAQATLRQIVRHESPNPARFTAVVGSLIYRLAAPPSTGLRIYGEMVDILAQDANFSAAYRLECLWNDLGASVPFTLFCGYTAVHFGDPRSAAALQAICGAHTHVRADSDDDLGAFLMSEARAPRSVSTF
jgi:hypothetical protein